MGKRLITWDPGSRRIVQDGDYRYEVTPGQGEFTNAAIGRTNGSGQSEFWHVDAAKGREIVQGTDGVKQVTSRFTSGDLAGKTRQIERIAGDKITVEQK